MKLEAKIDDRAAGMVTRCEADQKPIMKEGDYLRQRVVVDDIVDEDDIKKSGCLSFRTRSSTMDSPARRRCQTDCEHHSTKLAEKLRNIFRSRSEQLPASSSTNTTSKHKSNTSHHTEPPRRRFIRVVKDENAPPPECIGDNPNVICRYSQDFLTKHYADQERSRHLTAETVKPYTTTGHTILKKSSTDPTSDRPFSSAPSSTLKHTTFRDMVTVVDMVAGEVHEEQLHEDDIDGGSGSDDQEATSRQTGFFLDSADVDLETSTTAEDLVAPVEPKNCEEPEPKLQSSNSNAAGVMSVFSDAGTSCPSGGTRLEERSTTTALPSMKHVSLVDAMTQIRSAVNSRPNDDVGK